MSRTITHSEYRRRVFNAALLEAIRKPYMEAIGLTESLVKEPEPEPVQESAAQRAMRRLSEASGKSGMFSVPAAQNTKEYFEWLKDHPEAKLKDKVKAADPSNRAADAAPTNPDGSEKKPKKDEKPLNSCSAADAELCENMCNSYFTEELGLNESTVGHTIERLKGSNQYIIEAAEEAKEIADQHMAKADEDKAEIKDDDRIELTPEDHEVLDQLFHSKGPGPQIDQIRDATVKALLSEEKKSKEVRDALDLAQSKVSSGDVKAYNETASRLSKVGPTSLMGAIMNSMSRAAIRETSEAGNFTSIGDVMAENADVIKTRSVMLYAIMETGNQLEITHMSNKDVEQLANNIFYQK